MEYRFPVVAELVNALEHRRDGYVQYWEQFRDACGNDAEMRQCIDTFFVDMINKIEEDIERIQSEFCSF